MDSLDFWQLECIGPDSSKTIPIDLHYLMIFQQAHDQEYLKLKNISEKLDFYDNNRELFEFPYNQFCIKTEGQTLYSFDFKPAPHFLETHIYNPWFIKRSKEYLSLERSTITGIPFKTCEQLWNDFEERKEGIPLLKKFIKLEKKRIKELCKEHAPGRFNYWYEYKISDAKVLGPRHELTKEYWKELFCKEVVDYVVKLEKYGYDSSASMLTVEHQLQNPRSNSIKASNTKGSQFSPSKNSDLTFLQLFRNNKINVESFINILIRHEYLTPETKWNYKLYEPGILKLIIDFIENEGIIKNIKNRTQVGRIFNLQFSMNMSTRNYSKDKKKLELDLNLKNDLKSLII